MKFNIITIFPDVFEPYFNESIIKRARAKKLVQIKIYNLRNYTNDRHRTVDDRPYGGGAGMVFMVEPILKVVKHIRSQASGKRSLASGRAKVVLLSAKGKKFDQKMAKKFSKLDKLVLISGRYEGVDERVAKYIADEEISIGDYVLTGGELPAMIVVDAVVRLIPGVITEDSLKRESFFKEKYIEHPHYTRPEEIVINRKKRKVPKVLLSGDHKKIEEWRVDS
ncbi:MAG: tRNA (guanosine(37)-N1)-methyltransferase TrmD [Candidatus Portnoybacteria bacterium]|nr:tRNA (guanosine(37)-N1)-methyltransferase TrmD [Candidatus Portnoybacteria bacterium]